MSGSPSTPGIALCVALLLAALSLVAWRQGHAMTVMTELQRLQTEISLVRADSHGLRQRIQYLESRTRIVPEARDRLEMKMPDASELTILPGDLR